MSERLTICSTPTTILALFGVRPQEAQGDDSVQEEVSTHRLVVI